MSRISEKLLELIVNEQQQEINELKAHVERLREALCEYNRLYQARNYYPNTETQAESGYLDAHEEFHTVTLPDALEETPAQSINHIRAQVEEETIDMCVLEWREKGYLNRREITRKYKEQSNEGGE